LIQRVVTGVLLFLLVGFIGYINNFYLIWGFLGAVFLISIFEAIKIYEIESSIFYYASGVTIWISAIYISGIDIFLILLISSLSIIAYKPKLEPKIFFMFLYPTLPFLAIFEIYKIGGIEILSWLVVVVALTDSMAYFVGRAVGKRGFSPTSPKKTLEGVIGGVLFGTAGGLLFGEYLFQMSYLYLIPFSFTISIFAVFGDLFESYLKRRADIKDSGNILPGHGGILDRVDGYLLSAIAILVLFPKDGI
jgi:phosphatidate cytidylyltransferase